jgi:hypothetical protein
MTIVTMMRGPRSLRPDMAAGVDERRAYHHRTLVNVLALVVVTLLTMSGLWVVNTVVAATQVTQDIRLLAP